MRAGSSAAGAMSEWPRRVITAMRVAVVRAIGTPAGALRAGSGGRGRARA